jgi:protein-S-isoprenylcysteine O-methyltransferase Ste14
MNCRLPSLLYGIAAYAATLATFAYAVGFLANLFVPRSIDVGPPAAFGQALVIDLALLMLFALQHSVMARGGFKAWWTRFVPPAIERSTYVLAASAMLALVMWQWRPIAEPAIWRAMDPAAVVAIQAIFWLGWLVLLVSTSLIDHFELFGLEQVWLRFRGRSASAPKFRTPIFYRYVRHPIYVGFLMVFWAAPAMTAGHRLFSLGMTGYILVGARLEERDLVALFGDRYRAYQRRVGMLLPRIGATAPMEADEDKPANAR